MAKKLDIFRSNPIEDGCVIGDKCSYDAKTCEIKKLLNEILDNLDKYYTNIK